MNYLKWPVIFIFSNSRSNLGIYEFVHQVNKDLKKLFFYLFRSLVIIILVIFNTLSGVLIFFALMQLASVQTTFSFLAQLLTKLCTMYKSD